MATPLQTLKSEFFRVLAHPTRVGILEQLVQRERTVQQLQAALAVEQPIVSQHLAVLRRRGVVTVRREGTLAYYALGSPLIADLLRLAREFLNGHLAESRSLLQQLQREARRA
jgi:ArsR family transcriptional regulator, arsenate/arsenite/antimonite-responsive transcriptional repressor